MKTIRWCVALALAVGGAGAMRAAEESFSRTLSPADVSAAGLNKLTPEERARLDALVRDYKSGALEAARREAVAAEAARAKAEAAVARAEAAARSEAERAKQAEAQARAAQAERERAQAQKGEKGEKAEGSLLQRAKVLLTPGTQIEYSTLEARIAGEFRGWQPKMIFTLDNGQRWQVVGGESYIVSPEAGPKVKIVPGALGSFFMHVEGHRQRAKVAFVGDGR